ncbi:MAG: hypothetical protein FD123_2263 [Bacteroidetes bacterium]|nr:MAG: hypothetical protein FD123_2263 [Bacteroidota bacterium]
MREVTNRSFLQPGPGNTSQRRPVVSRRFMTFLLCLGLSTILWFFNALSKDYPLTLRLSASYVNLPADRKTSNRLPDSLDIEVMASGFKMLGWSVNKHTDPVRIDLNTARRPKGSDYMYIAFQRDLERIGRQFSKGVKVVRIQPDTIWFSFAPRAAKTIPVRANLDIKCKPGYRISDSIKITPATVEVTGQGELVQKITFVETDMKRFTEVDKNIKAVVRLQPSPEFRQLSFSPATVTVEIPVYRFTEASAEVPVTVEHVPDGVRLQLLRKKVKITYNVPLEQADSVDASMFRAVIDYRKAEKGGSPAKVQITRKPVFISNIRVEPEKVEFVIIGKKKKK